MTPRPAPPPDLAGRWLAKFFTDHLAGERAASPRTVAAYRDAMKLLLTWFKDAERIPPEKLRLADIDRPRVLRFLDWLETERCCSAATRNQRLAVIKSFCRYTAVEQPDRLDQVTQVLAIRQKNTPAPDLGHLTGDEVKALLAEPGTASARAVRDTVLLALAYDTAARVQELCDLDVADIRRSKPMTVAIRGKGSKIRYVPVMDPTARLVADYLEHRRPAPRPRRRRGPAVPRTEPLQVDPVRGGQAPGPPRASRPGPRPRLGSRPAGHAPHPPAQPGDAPDPGRRQPDLHPRPARPRRRVHHRDLRPRRRGDQTQSDRECLRATHPGRPARLDLGHLPDRLARLAGAVTPAAGIMRTKTLPARPPPGRNNPAGRITPPSA